MIIHSLLFNIVITLIANMTIKIFWGSKKVTLTVIIITLSTLFIFVFSPIFLKIYKSIFFVCLQVCDMKDHCSIFVESQKKLIIF